MIIQEFFADYSALLVMVIAFILIYIALKKLKIPGNEATHFILSLLLAFVLMSSVKSTSYLTKVLPYLTMIVVLTFVILMVLAFVTFKNALFEKILGWAGIIVAILIIIIIAFSHFSTLNHMLPESSNRGLDSNLREFKDFIYSQDFKENFIFVIVIAAVGFFILKK
jgi:amino acid transporter